ncbi:IS66-like element accessory protein TnpA [Trinickia mobilis]|uniref:IS66-like element accessory protein TnpA n=1 Tax=Trinickia mobilis TaxID=2816356 RepID=UPI001A8C9932|nr:transposase [Trinickia mobilis]
MSEAYSDFLPLRVVTVGTDGKQRYDKGDKQRLIEACLLPGVSVAGMALKAGVNANQLRRWIKQYKAKRKGGAAPEVLDAAPTAFVPVMEIANDSLPLAPEQPVPSANALPAPVRREAVHRSQRSPLPPRLVAQLPNGVSLELECSGRDATLLTAMIAALRAR